MSRDRIYINPAAIDSPLIRALTEHNHQNAIIFPRKRPKGTDGELARLRAEDVDDGSAEAGWG